MESSAIQAACLTTMSPEHLTNIWLTYLEFCTSSTEALGRIDRMELNLNFLRNLDHCPSSQASREGTREITGSRCFSDPFKGILSQPSHFSAYTTMKEKTKEDRGGVHFFSGTPNKALYIAADGHDGLPWNGVGQVWFSAMIDPNMGKTCSFSEFASLTIKHAQSHFSHLVAVIKKGRDEVGVAYQS